MLPCRSYEETGFNVLILVNVTIVNSCWYYHEILLLVSHNMYEIERQMCVARPSKKKSGTSRNCLLSRTSKIVYEQRQVETVYYQGQVEIVYEQRQVETVYYQGQVEIVYEQSQLNIVAISYILMKLVVINIVHKYLYVAIFCRDFNINNSLATAQYTITALAKSNHKKCLYCIFLMPV